MKVQISYHGNTNKPYRVMVNGKHSVYVQDEKTARQVRKLLHKVMPTNPWTPKEPSPVMKELINV